MHLTLQVIHLLFTEALSEMVSVEEWLKILNKGETGRKS